MKIRSFLRRFSFGLPHYLFVAALLVRLLALAHLSASPFLLPSAGDMHFYDDWAQRIVRGEPSTGGYHAFYGLPGYAYLLAFIYKICGYGPFVPALLQAVIDAGTAVLIFQLTVLVAARDPGLRSLPSATGIWRAIATHSREIAGILASAGWVFFVPAEAYAVILMPTSWVVFIFLLIVWQVARRARPPGPLECLFLGLLIGITATAIATILFLIPLILVALLMKRSEANRTWTRLGGVVLLGFGALVGTSPCWIHNYFVARDPVVLSAHSGINFWIGNNPEANGYPRFPPGLRAGQAAMLEDSINTAESAAGRSLKRAEVSRFWSDKARDYLSLHPSDWLKLETVKLRNLASAFQYDDLSIVSTLSEQGVIFPGIYFGLVAALALPGMILTWRNSAARWLLGAILLHLGALLPVFVTERYRLPMVPGLLVFAAAGLETVWQAYILFNWRLITLYVIALVGATLLVSWPQRNPSLWALDAYNTGRQALESNNLALAEKKLSLARAYVPDNAETNFALGNLRLAEGDATGATAFYERVLSIAPDHKGALNNLGVVALGNHNLPTARQYLQKALEQDPRSAKTHFLLAKTAVASGDLATARRELSVALKISPTQPEFLELEKDLTEREAGH